MVTMMIFFSSVMIIEVTYLYTSGIVTVPKQSEFNVNSYNKDTVNFVNANVLI